MLEARDAIRPHWNVPGLEVHYGSRCCPETSTASILEAIQQQLLCHPKLPLESLFVCGLLPGSWSPFIDKNHLASSTASTTTYSTRSTSRSQVASLGPRGKFHVSPLQRSQRQLRWPAMVVPHGTKRFPGAFLRAYAARYDECMCDGAYTSGPGSRLRMD